MFSGAFGGQFAKQCFYKFMFRHLTQSDIFFSAEISGTHSFTLRSLIPFYNNCSYLVAGHIFSLAEPWSFLGPFFFLDGEGFFPRILGKVLFIGFLLGIQICYFYNKTMVLQS